ncbi:6-phosphogluconolactonase [soil metagenome]
MNVIVYRDKPGLALAAARRVADTISASDRQVRIGLAGGSTPAETYRLLREMAVDWERVDAWVSDERWVPHEHTDCNGTMIAQLLMDHVPASFHRPRWATWLSAADSAAHYEAALRSIHPDGGSELILLGMGDDGHTASLFPGTEALEADPRRWYVENYVPQAGAERLTATYSFLHQAHEIAFLVSGGDKASALREVLEPVEGTTPPPAARVMDGHAEVTWLVDEAAAAELDATELTRGD